MPVTFKDAPSAERKEMHHIDPAEIVVDHSLNARRGQLDHAHVKALAVSFLTEGGQRTPVQVRKEGGRAKLVYGYHRHAAAMLIRQGFMYTDSDGHTRLVEPTPIRLACTYVDQNEAEAFRDSIVENRRARRTNAIDDAHNQRRLREVYKWPEADIARLYDTTMTGLSKVAGLLTLPPEVQRKVADQQLPLGGALALVDMPPTERDAALASATNGNGHVRAETIREVKRAAKREEGVRQARTYGEVKEAFARFAADEDDDNTAVRAFATAFGKFCAGDLSEKQLRNAIGRLQEAGK